MSEGFSNAIIGGAETLARTGVKSINFVTTVSGWRLDKDGNAEFNDVIIRGTVNIATGVVTINSLGITVTGPTEVFTINVTGGIRAKKIPDDGSFITVNSDGIFIHEKEPSPLLGLNSNSAVMQTDNINGGGSEWVRLKLFSPEWDSQLGTSSISLWSKSNGGGGTTIDLNANLIRHNAAIVEFNDEVLVRQTDGDPMFKQFFGNAVRNTDIIIPTTSPGLVLFTFTGATWKADRAYEVLVSAPYASAGGTDPLVALLTGTAASGTVLVDNGRVPYPGGSTRFHEIPFRFIVGGADVTRDICVVGRLASGGTVTQKGTNQNPALMEVFDIGPATRYANFAVIT